MHCLCAGQIKYNNVLQCWKWNFIPFVAGLSCWQSKYEYFRRCLNKIIILALFGFHTSFVWKVGSDVEVTDGSKKMSQSSISTAYVAPFCLFFSGSALWRFRSGSSTALNRSLRLRLYLAPHLFWQNLQMTLRQYQYSYSYRHLVIDDFIGTWLHQSGPHWVVPFTPFLYRGLSGQTCFTEHFLGITEHIGRNIPIRSSQRPSARQMT